MSTRKAFTAVTTNEAVAERFEASDTRAEKANCPAACEVPEMRPADDSASPGGSAPPDNCQVWGRCPPVATSAASNPDPTVAAARTFVSTTSGGTGRVVVAGGRVGVVAGGPVVVGVETPPPPDDVVVVGAVVVGGGATVVVDTVVVDTVVVGDADWMVVVGTVVSGAAVVSVEPTEVVEVGRIVVVGGGAGRVNTSTRCPWGKTCRSTSVTAALAT